MSAANDRSNPDSRHASRLALLLFGETTDQTATAADTAILTATLSAWRHDLHATPHELIVAPSTASQRDSLLALGDPSITVTSFREHAGPIERYERARAHTHADVLLVVTAGTFPSRTPGLAARLATHSKDADVTIVRPRYRDPSGLRLAPLQATGSCLAIRADAWAVGALTRATWQTPHVFDDLCARELADDRLDDLDDVEVITGGWADRAWIGEGARLFDLAVARESRRDNTARALYVALGDPSRARRAACAFDVHAARWPHAEWTVLTGHPAAFVTARQPITRFVLPPEAARASSDPWVHDACLRHTVQGHAFDRIVFGTAEGADMPAATIDERPLAVRLSRVTPQTHAILLELPGSVADADAQRTRARAQLRATSSFATANSIASVVDAWSSWPDDLRRACHSAAAFSCERRRHTASASAHRAIAESVRPKVHGVPLSIAHAGV